MVVMVVVVVVVVVMMMMTMQAIMDDAEVGTISLFWQLPQYLFLSLAEILVCVSALELAYEDAPPHLRGLVNALWFISQVSIHTVSH